MKVALYTRVSTSDQSTDSQLLELRRWVAATGAEVVGEYTDTMSGTRADRPGLAALLAAKGHEAVAVVKLDRLGRSVINTVALVRELDARGVAVICTSQGIDTRRSSPCGTMLLQVMAAFAEFERATIVERVTDGLKAARARGVVLGKPSAALAGVADVPAEIRAWRSAGRPGGYRGLAKQLGGCSVATAHRLDKEANLSPQQAA